MQVHYFSFCRGFIYFLFLNMKGFDLWSFMLEAIYGLIICVGDYFPFLFICCLTFIY